MELRVSMKWTDTGATTQQLIRATLVRLGITMLVL